MNTNDKQFLIDLLEAPSPSGYETRAAEVFRNRLKKTCDSIQTDVMGSVLAKLEGDAKYPSVMLTGHIDEIGFGINYISDDGFLYFKAIGGIDTGVLPGTRVQIVASSGIYNGVIGRKPVHLMDADERKKLVPFEKLFIDVGMSGEEAKKTFRIGDPISFGLGYEEIGAGFFTSRAIDDKAGTWIIARVMEEVKKSKKKHGDLIVVATVQEEIGLRGAKTASFGANPDIGIAVDTHPATDHPDSDSKKDGLAECGKGPLITRGPNINPVLFERFIDSAEKSKVPYQISLAPRGTGTDANSIQLTRAGKATGLFSVPLRYLHTPSEVAKLTDLEDTVKVLTHFVLSLKPGIDLTPA
jgi:endoglucanase